MVEYSHKNLNINCKLLGKDFEFRGKTVHETFFDRQRSLILIAPDKNVCVRSVNNLWV